MNLPSIPKKPIGIATALPIIAAYTETIEIPCEECCGSGRDVGSLDHDPPPCPECHGSCVETVTRNFLAEAFSIVSNANNHRSVERKHLIAVVRFAREHVSALIQLPEVA